MEELETHQHSCWSHVREVTLRKEREGHATWDARDKLLSREAGRKRRAWGQPELQVTSCGIQRFVVLR